MLGWAVAIYLVVTLKKMKKECGLFVTDSCTVYSIVFLSLLATDCILPVITRQTKVLSSGIFSLWPLLNPLYNPNLMLKSVYSVFYLSHDSKRGTFSIKKSIENGSCTKLAK